MYRFFASTLLLPDGFAHDMTMTVGSDGLIQSIEPGRLGDTVDLDGIVCPPLSNIHSHAFQRAMAGLAEYRATADHFWSWRDVMYRFVQTVTPDEMGAIARQLYLEMLQAGTTAAVEFHYVHHDVGGAEYSDPATMAWPIMNAAQKTGLRLTLAPVLYSYGGCGGQPLQEGQKRFGCDLQWIDRLYDKLRPAETIKLALAPHSVRAVTPEQIKALLAHYPADWPVHIHVAEQMREVQQSLEAYGETPVQLLLNRFGLDKRWCLIHALNMDAQELTQLAASGATVGLCPSSEANLGDGFFALPDWLDKNGALALGSDSHVNVDLTQDVRLLDYGQRLLQKKRGIFDLVNLYQKTANAAAITGWPVGRLEPGFAADWVVLDAGHPALVGKKDADVLHSWLLSAGRLCVKHVYVGGKQVIQNGRHQDQDAITNDFRTTMHHIMARI